MATTTPATLRREGLDYGMFEAAPAALRWLREAAPPPARIRVVGDDDTDGAASAFVLATALRRAGYHADTLLQALHTEADVERALASDHDVWVVADAGSAFLPQLDRHGKPVLVVDHHRALDHRPKHVHELNPRRVGGNETWGVSASVLAALVALELDARNWDLAPAGIAGGMSDRQHLGGFHGLLAYLVDGAARGGYLVPRQGLTLDGDTVAGAIVASVDPYFVEYASDASATEAFLRGLGIDPGADPLGLDDAASHRLADALTRALERHGASERSFPLFGPNLLFPGHPARHVLRLTRLLEAVLADGGHGLAFALLEGRPGAVDEARVVHRQRERRLLLELAALRTRVEELPRLRHVETQDAANTGVYAHVLLGYVFGDDKPFLVFAPVPGGLKASARGSPRLFLAGLDLAIAVANAARSVGGHGGGHPGAAGCTVPAAAKDAFLAALQNELARLSREGVPRAS